MGDVGANQEDRPVDETLGCNGCHHRNRPGPVSREWTLDGFGRGAIQWRIPSHVSLPRTQRPSRLIH